jgi:hypothetical protein
MRGVMRHAGGWRKLLVVIDPERDRLDAALE